MTQEEPKDLDGEGLESAKEEHSELVVDFWAEWCGPCKRMEPIMESLTQEYGDQAFFGKVNVEEERDAASKYGIASIPTVLFFKNGEEVDRVIGALPEDQLGNKIEEIIESS